MENKGINWEKIGVYAALVAGFITVIVYIADIKERVAKLEVKIENIIENDAEKILNKVSKMIEEKKELEK